MTTASVMLGCGKGSKKITIDASNKSVKPSGAKEFMPIGVWFAQLGRKVARQYRKLLRSKGYGGLAGVSRTA